MNDYVPQADHVRKFKHIHQERRISLPDDCQRLTCDLQLPLDGTAEKVIGSNSVERFVCNLPPVPLDRPAQTRVPIRRLG